MDSIKEDPNINSRSIFFNLEIRPLLKTVNVTVCSRNKNSFSNILKVSLGKSQISLHVKENEKEKKYSIVFPLNFIPDSLSCLTLDKNGLTFRCQIKDKLSLEDKNITTATPIKPGTSYKGICTFCRTNVLKSGTSFQRAVSLPSEWALDSASEWFCHSHGGNHFDLNSRLQPKENEIFEGEDYVLINVFVLDVTKLDLKGREIYCRRCLHVIGKTSVSNPAVFHFFKHSICFRLCNFDDLPCVSRSNGEETKNALWTSLLAKYNNMTTRIVIKNSSKIKDSSSVLLLWLVDVGIKRFTAELAEETEISGKELKNSWKILYSLENSSSTVAKEWTKNSSSEFLHLDNDIFLFFVNTLLEKTVSLPSSLQKISTFWVAYICLEK